MTVVEAGFVEELLEALRRVTGRPGLELAGPPQPLTGGFWAELVTFQVVDGPDGWDRPLVARVMPDAATAAKETAFQAEIAAAGYPTPTVRAAGGPDEGVDGRAFLVMDLAAGRSLLEGLDGVGALAKLPSLLRRLPVTLARALAELHRLDPDPVARRLDAAGVERPSLERMLDWIEVKAGSIDRADLAAAARWLRDNRPPGEVAVLCHGDLHPFNVLVDDAGGLTVLDWSAASLAPATYDLGFTSVVMSEPPMLVPAPLRPVARAAGRALARRFVRAYERAAGLRVDPAALRYHQTVVCLRALSEVAGWSADGSLDQRAGHPWVIAADAFATRLSALTGVAVRPR